MNRDEMIAEIINAIELLDDDELNQIAEFVNEMVDE